MELNVVNNHILNSNLLLKVVYFNWSMMSFIKNVGKL